MLFHAVERCHAGKNASGFTVSACRAGVTKSGWQRSVSRFQIVGSVER